MQYNKLFIETVANEQLLVITFTYVTRMRKIVNMLNKNLDGLKATTSKKIFHIPLTERNVVEAVRCLPPLHFDITPNIMDYYNYINLFDETLEREKFSIDNNKTLYDAVYNELGPIEQIPDIILADRSIRYQYHITREEEPLTLTELIAYRTEPDIWIDSNLFTITDIIDSLVELKRLPLLIVFNKTFLLSSNQVVELLKPAFEKHLIDNVGIHFREPSGNQQGRKFNRLIVDSDYTKILDIDTQVAGISDSNFPKFFLKNDWKPMSILSLNSPTIKSATYANCCDLIITYSPNKPIINRNIK